MATTETTVRGKNRGADATGNLSFSSSPAAAAKTGRSMKRSRTGRASAFSLILPSGTKTTSHRHVCFIHSKLLCAQLRGRSTGHVCSVRACRAGSVSTASRDLPEAPPHHLHRYNTHRRTSKSQQCDVTTAARQVRSKEALPVIGGSGSKSCQEQDDGAEQQ